MFIAQKTERKKNNCSQVYNIVVGMNVLPSVARSRMIIIKRVSFGKIIKIFSPKKMFALKIVLIGQGYCIKQKLHQLHF